MSDKDKIFRVPSEDQSDRTVMIPSSGRRRRAGQYDSPPPPVGPPIGTEDWSASPSRQDYIPSQALGAAVPILVKRHEMGAANANAVLRAAAPLLLTLGGLRVAFVRTSISELMEEVAEAITDFDKDLHTLIPLTQEQARTAKYILCATADDIVQNLPGDKNTWTQYSMLSRFFGERNSGITFFEILDRLKRDPVLNCDILELQHACLGLGFQGMHRTSAGNTAALQQIQRNLFETIRRVRSIDSALSPHWRGKPIKPYAARFRIPLWTIAAFLSVLLFGLYIFLRTLLGNQAQTILQAANLIHPPGEIAIQRRVFSPPPPPSPPTKQQMLQVARVKQALSAELADHRLSVEQTADEIVVRLGTFALFAPADAQVKREFEPVADRIAAMLENEIGPVKVAGFTDNTPLKSLKFPSNYELSLARSRTVAVYLKKAMSDPARLQIFGRGEDRPIGNNDTIEGRALNRRVEITFPRVD
jgi:type VI secretion system protein ImpK